MAAGAATLLLAAGVAAYSARPDLAAAVSGRAGGGLLVAGLAVCAVARCVALFSNSFIVAERSVAHFLLASLLISWALWGAPRARGAQGGSAAGARERVGRVVGCLVVARAAAAHTAMAHEKCIQEASTAAVSAAAGMVVLQARLQLGQLLEGVPFWVRVGLPRAVFLLTLLPLSAATAPHASDAKARRGGAAGVHSVVEALALPLCLLFGADGSLSVAAGVSLSAAVVVLCSDGGGCGGGRVVRELLLCLAAVQVFFCSLRYSPIKVFYASGHRPTFEAVQYGAAFVGANAGAAAAGAILTAGNTVGAFLLVLPAAFTGGEHDGGVVQLYFALTLAMTAVFVGIERRHLMVWAIFAPKLVYEVVLALVVDAILLLSAIPRASGG
ncbi:hypothetical protein T484DRAFT_1810423 [Baffinella frigidus]|nr:hypothetical protein T484DRAFT_1810423 [Cryptophyta sp. CCMP2293]